VCVGGGEKIVFGKCVYKICVKSVRVLCVCVCMRSFECVNMCMCVTKVNVCE
jgi:hypothetical protein